VAVSGPGDPHQDLAGELAVHHVQERLGCASQALDHRFPVPDPIVGEHRGDLGDKRVHQIQVIGLVGGKGVPFDTVSGLPESKMGQQAVGTWFDHARTYTARHWIGTAAKTRSTVADCLASSTRALVVDPRGAPEPRVMHTALATWAFNKARMESQVPPAEIAAALAWLEKKSLPITELEDPSALHRALDGLAVNLDGKPAAPKSVKRRRSVFNACLDYAVELKLLAVNPLKGLRWEAPKTVEQVDPRQVPNPDQARALLAAVLVVAPRMGRHLYAFFACLYFAGLRPSEAVALTQADCALPATGWGKLLLVGSSPAAGRQWTDDGKYHQVHACLSLWLNGGVPAANVAARAGHSVAMLQSTYAHCIDGDEEIMNRHIDAALGTPHTPATERAEQTSPTAAQPQTVVPWLFRDYRRTAAHRGSRLHTPRNPSQGVSPGEATSGQVGETSPGEDVRRLHSAG
jgi:hypothetical protein